MENRSIAMKSFGLVLESLMRERNLSVRALAKELKLPHKTVAEWIGASGRVPRHPESLKKLAEYFGVSIHYLLFGEQDPHNFISDVLDKTELHSGLYEITIKKVKTRSTKEEK